MFKTFLFAFLAGQKRLKSGAVPCVFTFRPPLVKNTFRAGRATKREKNRLVIPDVTDVSLELEIGDEVSPTVGDIIEDVTKDSLPQPKHAGVQCNLLHRTVITLEQFAYSPNVIQYYTGLDDYDHFMLVFNVLGENAQHIGRKFKMLTAENQMFLTVMKLRQAKEDFELALLFGISKSTASRIFETWMRFMYFQLRELDIWPSKHTINDTMPQQFKAVFSNTRVIIGTTEIPIQKPTNVTAQCSTFSTYKNRNTLKAIIGCSPRGLVIILVIAMEGVPVTGNL